MIGATLLVLAQAAATTASPPSPTPLTDNKPCPYPEAARKAPVSLTVLYLARVTPEGSVASVDVPAVALPELGFEDAVRACVSAWRFDRAPEGQAELRSYSGRIRFTVRREDEEAIRGLTAKLAEAWNSGKKDAVQQLEPRWEGILPISQRKPFLRDRIKEVKGVDECVLAPLPDASAMRFVALELVEVRQVYGCSARRGGASVPGRVTLDLAVAKGPKGWVFIDREDADRDWYLTPRAGVDVPEPKVLKRVEPSYPTIAAQARVQGLVTLACMISPEGRATDFKVLRGIPLLDQAAIDAVAKWEFEPTLRDGVAIRVALLLDVPFRLR
jgi:TonB family protein